MNDQHQHDWLSLVGVSGLLVSEPVLHEFFPDGPPPLSRKQERGFRREWNRWLAASEVDDSGPLRRWVGFIIDDLLGYGRFDGSTSIHKYPNINEKLVVNLLDYEQKLWPDQVLVGPKGQAQALIYIVPRGHDLDKRETETGRWRASPYTKLDRLLKETRVPIGLLTNGDQWRIVFLEQGLPSAYLEWSAQGWNDERTTLYAFAMLFGVARFDQDDDEEGNNNLIALIHESQNRQTDVADKLGDQVRSGLRALVRALDEADQQTGGDILGEMSLEKIYEMALVVMMRLVFLLYAEENGLLPHGEVLYDNGYGLTYLWTRLQRQRREDPQNLRRTFDAWPQLLASFNLVYHGVEHPDFAMPAYGGRLFDPERFRALLDKRLRIPNSAIYRMLHRLLLTQAEYGGETLTQRVSYRTLGVEQLGYVYEGLLGYTLRRAEETFITFAGRGGYQRPLVELAEHETGEEELYEYLKSVSDLHWMVARQVAEQAMAFTPSPGADVFERLTPYGEILDLEDIIKPGNLMVVQDVGIRKRTGTYYTPIQITSFLVKQALEPLCYAKDEEEVKRVIWPEQILDLKVCDPAMGSGAFLVQACRYLAESLVKSWEVIEKDVSDTTILTMPHASPADSSLGEVIMPTDRSERVTWAKRYVAERCLYGVDLNPMAVELAKLSLWLETLSKNRPFTFLDHHLRHGNSLIGASLLAEEEITVEAKRRTSVVEQDKVTTVRQIDFIPDAALDYRKGADKEARKAARERQKQNQAAVQKIAEGQLWLGGEYNVSEALEKLREQRAELSRATHEADDYETKERILHQIHNEGYFPQFRALCNLWCAVWFWAPDRYGPPPTTWEYIELANTIIHSMIGVARVGTTFMPASEDQGRIFNEVVKEIAEKQAFFHWELEFPEVFGRDNSGFDVIVGNPPWEKVEVNSQEFFEAFDPRFRDYGKQDALSVIDELVFANIEIRQDWESYQSSIYSQYRYFRDGPNYSLQSGKIDTYKVFTERAFNLLCEGGLFSIVLPSGIYTDYTSQGLRELLFDHTRIVGLYSFENRETVFPIHRSFKFTLLTTQRGREGNGFPAFFMKHHLSELSDLNKAVWVPLRLVERFSPDSHSVMEFQDQEEIDLVGKLYDDHPLVGEELSTIWNSQLGREFNMTDDSYLFNEEGNGVPLYEGKMIWQFDPYYASPRYWIIEEAGREARLKDEDYGQELPYQDHRIGYRDTASATNERTFIAAVLPKNVFCNNKIPNVVSTISYGTMLYIVAMFNSFCMDFLIRMKVSTTLNMFYIEQLPMPRLNSGNPYFDAIVYRATRLNCTSEDFAELWQEVIGTEWPSEPGSLSDEDRRVWGYGSPTTAPLGRKALRDELDALVAHLYGLTREEFDYILGTFPLVFPDTEEGRAKRERLLGVYDEFQKITAGWSRE